MDRLQPRCERDEGLSTKTWPLRNDRAAYPMPGKARVPRSSVMTDLESKTGFLGLYAKDRPPVLYYP